MKKGIVMEITEEYVTMLTPDGEFLRSRHEQRQYELGEEILFFPIMHDQPEVSETKIKRHSWRRAVFSSVAAAALLLFFIPYYMQQQVYAYMSIDINPSLELGVNRQFEVVEIQTFNEDAKKLVASIKDWNHHPVEEVTSQILAASEQQGYLKREKEVLITTVFKKEKKDYKKQLQTDIQAVTDKWEKKPYAIETVKSSLETREKAKEQGVSTGTWLRKEEKIQKPASKPVKSNVTPEVNSKEPVKASSAEKGESVPASPVKKADKQTENVNSTLKPIKQQVESKLNNSKQELPKGEGKESKPSPQPAEKAKEKEKDADKQKKSTSASYQRPGIEKEKQKGNDGKNRYNSSRKENEKGKNDGREKKSTPPRKVKEQEKGNEKEKKPAFSSSPPSRQGNEKRENDEKKDKLKPSHLNSSSKGDGGRVKPVFPEKKQRPEQSHSKPVKIENQREDGNGRKDHKKDRPDKRDPIL